MMDIALFQIDAFTDHAFGGNPAAICPLDAWLADDLLLAIAVENNLSETAYLVPHEGDDADFHLRWFTPATEVDLCGHATLAAAHMLFSHVMPSATVVRFTTLSGVLTVTKQDGKMVMDFPVDPDIRLLDTPLPGLADAMGAAPLEVHQGVRDYLLIYSDAATVRALTPDMVALKKLGRYGYIACAVGDNAGGTKTSPDYVSRFFAPSFAIDEDPVTGSAHCLSGPYFADKLGKQELYTQQISARVGDLWLKLSGDRIAISGTAVEVLSGMLHLDI